MPESDPPTVDVRLYAELNDLVRRPSPTGRYRVPVLGTRSVKDVVESLGVPHTEVDLLLLDGRSVGFDATAAAGQRVAAYPVFEAFDVAPVQRVRVAPLREPRFLLDVHLRALARHLRLLGFDAADGEVADAALAARSRAEHRILLTRDRGLLQRREVTHGYLVRDHDPEQQVREVLDRFALHRLVAPFTRCLRCNGRLHEVTRAEVMDQLPPRTRREHHRFVRCDACGRVYWPGSHHGQLQARVQRLLDGAGGPRRGRP